MPAILLAAGNSCRMGVCKQLLPIAGKPAIVHCVETLIHAGVFSITVVVGKYRDVIQQTLGRLPVKIVENWHPNADMADSVRTGMTVIRDGASGVMICLSDYPLITCETIEKIMEMHCNASDNIIIPVYREKNGHPVIFPAQLLTQIHQGGTLRDIIRAHPDRVQRVPVDDFGVVMDMDTQQDYQNILKYYNQMR